MRKLGLIAGGGEVPIRLAAECVRSGRPLFVVRLSGFADVALTAYDGVDAGIAEVGKVLRALRAAQCEAVCLVGNVSRPDFARLRPDWRGMQLLPKAIAAAGKGDDALMRVFVDMFEQEGFAVEGAESVHRGLTLGQGALGRYTPTSEHLADIRQGVALARALGRFDVGQAVAVARGLVLAVEAQEGTDAMLARCAELPEAIRGRPGALAGVLVKWPKPIQERRIDLPTIGVRTIEAAHHAGFAGVAGEAGGLLVVDRDAVAEAADRLGLFVVGMAPEPDV